MGLCTYTQGLGYQKILLYYLSNLYKCCSVKFGKALLEDYPRNKGSIGSVTCRQSRNFFYPAPFIPFRDPRVRPAPRGDYRASWLRSGIFWDGVAGVQTPNLEHSEENALSLSRKMSTDNLMIVCLGEIVRRNFTTQILTANSMNTIERPYLKYFAKKIVLR